MSLLRFPEKRYLKNAIYGTVTLLPIAVVGPKPCVVSARKIWDVNVQCHPQEGG